MSKAEEYIIKFVDDFVTRKTKDMNFDEQISFINSNEYDIELLQSFADEQVKKALEEKNGVIYTKIYSDAFKDGATKALEEIEKSLMSDKEIMKTSKKGYDDIYSEGVHDGLHIHRRKIQEAINKLRP